MNLFVSKQCIFLNFSSYSLENDIALLRLNVYHYTSCPHIKLNVDQSFKGKKCLVMGYGSPSLYKSIVGRLQKTYVPVISNDNCRDIIGYIMMRSNTICSRNEGGNPCQGDSGGPLICSGYLVGVISSGPSCHTIGVATVYTEVASYSK